VVGRGQFLCGNVYLTGLERPLGAGERCDHCSLNRARSSRDLALQGGWRRGPPGERACQPVGVREPVAVQTWSAFFHTPDFQGKCEEENGQV
jgi:hypothetical protein